MSSPRVRLVMENSGGDELTGYFRGPRAVLAADTVEAAFKELGYHKVSRSETR
jgi:hypothetical protein